MLNTAFLSGIPAECPAEGWLLLRTCRLLTAKNNEKYLNYEGLDASGTNMWGTYFARDGNPLPMFELGSIVCVKGKIGEGASGGLSVWADSIVQVTDERDISDFKDICFPTIPKEELDKYINDLELYSKSFSTPFLNELSHHLFEYFRPFLRITPAGRVHHEPLRGGLTKHTWEVVSLVNNSVLLNKSLNRDVLIFSALYHDVGKTKEYSPELTWASDGRLLSHAAVAIELIGKASLNLKSEIDEHILRQIKHCIISHHGEFAELKPVTREAITIHYADHLMAKLGHFDEYVRKGDVGNDGWGKKSNWLKTSPYFPDMDTKQNTK